MFRLMFSTRDLIYKKWQRKKILATENSTKTQHINNILINIALVMLVRKNNACLVTGLEGIILNRMILLKSDDFSLTRSTATYYANLYI